tara:strand:+ start:425 stop:616 length:192 start_codon:yes stop_codon:yes gene_type:complete
MQEIKTTVWGTFKYAEGDIVRTQFRPSHLRQIDGQWYFVVERNGRILKQEKVWNISEKYNPVT